MQLCGREFSSETIAQIEETVRANPSLSRRALSLRVCEWLQWRSINGRLKEVSCRKALLELNRRGLITLPAAEESCFKRSRRRPFMDHPVDVPEVRVHSEGTGRDKNRCHFQPLQQDVADLERADGTVPLPGQRAVMWCSDSVFGRKLAVRMGRRTCFQRCAVAFAGAR